VCDETATARDPAPADAREGLGRDGIRTLRFALAITWAVSRLGHLPRNEDGHLFQEREIFLRRSRRASARHCSHHGSSTWRRYTEIPGEELDEQLRCREHNPRHEQGRTCKQQEIVEDSGHHIPHAHGPTLCRRARAAADVMGIPPTLRTTPDGSIGSEPNVYSLVPYVFVLFLHAGASATGPG
jgi:hypothetical protein